LYSLANGQHNISINCTDGNNNSKYELHNMTLADNTAPTISAISSSGATTTATSGTATLTLTTDEPATCWYGTTNMTNASLVSSSTQMSQSSYNLTHTASISYSSSTTTTYYVTCRDMLSNNMTFVNTTSITFSVGAAAEEGTSGGGGSVPTKSTITGVSTSHGWDVINPESPVTMTINKAEIPITSLTIDVKNIVTSVEVSVGELTAAPTTDKVLTTDVYKYITIDKTKLTNEDIDSITIQFKVEKSWLTENNVGDDQIVLVRYTDTWAELATEKLSSDATYIYYKATSPGLSYFAITTKGAAETLAAPGEVIPPKKEVTPPAEEKPPVTPPAKEVTPPAQTPTVKPNIPWIAGLIVLAVIVIGVIVYFVAKKK